MPERRSLRTRLTNRLAELIEHVFWLISHAVELVVLIATIWMVGWVSEHLARKEPERIGPTIEQKADQPPIIEKPNQTKRNRQPCSK
jgi:hypothetical protein